MQWEKGYMDNYEQKYNSPGSEVKADVSWERYMNPTEKRKAMRKRYDYSVDKLYGSVLDVGCGDGFGMYRMSQSPRITHITGLEIHDKNLREAENNLMGINNVKIIKGIGEKMPFKDGFDCIHCGHTLEHVFDDLAVLLEIKRLLEGVAVISVPINGGISLQHIREYTIEGFTSLINKHFNILESKTFIAHVKSFVVVVNKKLCE